VGGIVTLQEAEVAVEGGPERDVGVGALGARGHRGGGRGGFRSGRFRPAGVLDSEGKRLRKEGRGEREAALMAGNARSADETRGSVTAMGRDA
jgi:hypothetical protein